MQYPIFFFAFLAFLSGNPTAKEPAENKPLTDSLSCPQRLMPIAWYPYGPDNTLPPLTDQRKEFVIVVDKNCKDTNGKHVIRILNNTTETVFLQTQNRSLMAVMQGLTKSGQWCSLEFWQYNKCARGYHNLGFRPNAKGTFVAQLPSQGNYETKFRFKLVGADRFYYSDEFTGKIDYCAFADSALERFIPGDTIIDRGGYFYKEYQQ